MIDLYEMIFNYFSNFILIFLFFLEIDIVLKFVFVKYDFCKDMFFFMFFFG